MTSTTWPVVTRDYDAFGRLVSEASARLGNLSWLYDSAGRVARQTWGDGVAVNYSYLATGEMKAVGQVGSNVPIATYEYDDLGRRTTLTRGNAKVVTSYGYTADSPYSHSP